MMFIVRDGNTGPDKSSRSFKYYGSNLAVGDALCNGYVLRSPIPLVQRRSPKTPFLTQFARGLPKHRSLPNPGDLYVLKFFDPIPEDANDSTLWNYHAAQQSLRSQFLAECNFMWQTRHPNVARVVDYGYTKMGKTNLYWIAEEYVPGRDLAEIINCESTCSPDEIDQLCQQNVIDDDNNLRLDFIAKVLYDITTGLIYLHSKDLREGTDKSHRFCRNEDVAGDEKKKALTHGDIRPANIVVANVLPRAPLETARTLEDEVLVFDNALGTESITGVLIDMGSANIVGNPGWFQLGSFMYRSPDVVKRTRELELGSLPTDVEKTPADRWALGMTLFEMITGQLPYGIKVKKWTNSQFPDAREEIFDRIENEPLTLPSDIIDKRRYQMCADPAGAEELFDLLVRKLLQRNRGVRMPLTKVLQKLEKYKDAYRHAA